MVTVISTVLVCAALVAICKFSDGLNVHIHIHHHNESVTTGCKPVDNAALQKAFDDEADKVNIPTYDEVLKAINEAFSEDK